MSLVCSQCPQLVFDSLSEKRNHARAKHQQQCKIKHANGIHIVHISTCGNWICPHPLCSVMCTRPGSLQRHYKSTHKSEGQDSIGEELMQEEHSQEGPSFTREATSQPNLNAEDSTSVARDLQEMEAQCETPEILRKARLSIVRYAETMILLYCHSCDTMVDGGAERCIVEHIQSHFSIQGRRRKETPPDKDPNEQSWDCESFNDFKQAIRGIQFTPLQDLRYHLRQWTESRVVAQIPLLSVQNGWSCSKCDYHGVNKKVIKNHKARFHRGDSGFHMNRSTVQMVSHGAPRRYFAVQSGLDPTQDPTNNSLYAKNQARRSALFKEIADMKKKTLQADRDPPPRQLCPWLQDSKWNLYATQLIPENARFENIKSAMEVCKNDVGPYSRVKDVLRGYANALRNKVLKIAEFKVRRAVAQDTVKGFTEFMALATIDQYLPVMTGFLLCLLRSACDPPSGNIVAAPDELKDYLQVFKRQLQSLSGLPIEDDFDYQVVHKLLLAIWTPRHELKFKVTRSKDCLLVQFMILYSLRACSGGDSSSYAWMHVSEVAKMLSMLKFWCRSTIEMELCRQIWNPAAEDMDIEDAEKLIIYTDANITLRETPFSYLCAMQKLASTIAGDEPIRPQLIYNDPTFTECSIGGYSVTLDGFRGMIKALIGEATTIMEEEVLRGLKTDWIQQLLERDNNILDNLNRRDVGYSFLSDENNVFQMHEEDLHVHMFDDSSSQFITLYNADGTIAEYNQKRLGLWMKACTRLELLLGILLHFTAGQPPRAKEYESFMIRNTTSNERSFFWSQGTLVQFQVYNKTDSKPKRKLKLVVRFLPLCLRVLFLQYLSLVRPVQSFVAGKLWNSKAGALYRNAWFVRMGEVNDPEILSQGMKREFSKHCNAPFGIREYRHVAKFFCGSIREESKALQEEPLDASAGHSIRIAGRCYAQNLYDHRHVGRDCWRQFKYVAEKWQRLLQLPTNLLTDFTRQTLPTRPPGTIRYRLSRDENTHPYQPSIGSHQSHGASSPSQMEVEFWPPRASKRRRRLFHTCEGESEVGNDTLENMETFSMHQAKAALARFCYLDWKIPEQAIAVAMALDNTTDFIAILPTGSGKTFVFMAAAIMSHKTTIVVVPLFMLIKGHLEECRLAHISAAEWRRTIDPTNAPSIVFVPVEIAVIEDFRIWVKDLNTVGNLHSIFIDEVHLVLASYRHKMSQLIQLSFLTCQMIGLTASLPPCKEIAIKSTLGRPFTVVRAKTIRLNLQYGVIEAVDIDARILQCLQEWLSSSPAPKDRAMVYCMTKHDAEAFHGYLTDHHIESSFIHAHVEPPAEKVARLRTWEEGNTKILVATSIIGCGYNYPCVRLVLHKGTFYTLEGYHQESGRCGRDNREGICQVVSNADYRRWTERMYGEASGFDVLQDLKKANGWIENNSICRRYNLHREMDGEPAVCVLLPGAVKCDICAKRSLAFNSREGNSSNDRSVHQPNEFPLESIAPTVPFVIRPNAIRQEQNKSKNIRDLRYVRACGGDGKRCLLCCKDHPIDKCGKMKGLCLRCLSECHRVFECPVKEAIKSTIQHYDGCCYKCYFQMDPIGDVAVHKWSDQFGSCLDDSGERIRILIWHFYRCADTRTKLRRLFTSMPCEDIRLEPWLLETEADHMLNNFVRVAAVAIEMRSNPLHS